MSGIEVKPCICGGRVRIMQVDEDTFYVHCIDCNRRGSTMPLESAIEMWNEWQDKPDTWVDLFAEFQDYYCEGWCNLFDERCDDPMECRIYGFKKRAAKLIDEVKAAKR